MLLVALPNVRSTDHSILITNVLTIIITGDQSIKRSADLLRMRSSDQLIFGTCEPKNRISPYLWSSISTNHQIVISDSLTAAFFLKIDGI
ncbi:hypothetical protein [Mucilaginibacter rubeus]|uniref:hypothetical protein n=1 Tax=Mucilaginibacter rubeus TaxID=2027860 RepID=UPI001668AF55|nr:hypothetical protein [Mucilaginibacter rubeus]